jgi:hypothetical protein
MSVRRRTYIVGPLSLVVAVLVLGGGLYTFQHRKPARNCDFPKDITQASTGLKLYCPDAAKLPGGITVDLAKASSSANAVIYPIHDGPTTLSASLQPKPTADQLTNFVANIIPLHFDANTSIGKGAIGVTNQGRSLLELPTTSSTWILVTGPKDYDSDRLVKIAKAFVAD